jgi:hypothetical protein
MKLFKENKWNLWWDSLPSHTQTYLKAQPIWHDADLYKALAIGFVVGFIIGIIA